MVRRENTLSQGSLPQGFGGNSGIKKDQKNQERKDKSHKDTAFIIVFVLPLGFLLVGLWFHFFGNGTGVCSFKTLTSLPCVSCGMTRSSYAFLAGDFLGSFMLNPLLIPSILFFSGVWVYNFLWLMGVLPNKYSIYQSPPSDFVLSLGGNRYFGYGWRIGLGLLLILNWIYLVLDNR